MSSIKRKVLTVLSEHDMLTAADIGNAADLLPDRGLAVSLTSLYRNGLVECPDINPVRYRITERGRQELARVS